MPDIIKNNESTDTASEESSIANVVFESVKLSILDLCAKGKVQYSLKNYEQAADIYSRATELQAELNGEMNPDNAEILFLYGQSLFKLGQSKSDVLGGGAAHKRKKPESPKTVPKSEINERTELRENPSVDYKISSIPIRNDVLKNNEQNILSDSKKPFFQFTGDENFEESDEDVKENLHGNDENEDDEDEEEDDLAAAFDVLDLARILLEKKLDLLNNVDDRGETSSNSSLINHFKERLADTHDLLAEISLENERFSAAVTDCRAALAYKKELYTQERSIIAEAHFKLSLALEFASITSTADEKLKTEGGTLELDQSLRDEAVKEMEAAIKSTELKLQAKEAEISSTNSQIDTETTFQQISEVKEMLSELQTRLEELKGPAIDVKSILFGQLTHGDSSLDATTLNKSPIDVATRAEETKRNAFDVNGLVRKKPKVAEVSDSNGLVEKRKSDDNDENENKRAKIGNIDTDNIPHDT